MDLDTILDDCLERLKAGATVAECLARYPEHAPTLAPMLRAAHELRPLAGFSLSSGQKLRSKVAMRAALAERATPLPLFPWMRLRAMPVAVALSLVLFVTFTVSAIASSQPGDLAYPLRVMSERVPAFIQFDPVGRVHTELSFAERRLVEARRAHPSTLQALLASEKAAARRAEYLTLSEQIVVVERISAHAQQLATLAEQAEDPAVSHRLEQVAEEVHKISARLMQSVATPMPPVPTAIGGVTPSATPSSTWTVPAATRTLRPQITEVRSSLTPQRPPVTATRPARPTVAFTATIVLSPIVRPTVTPWAWPTGSATWVPGATVIPVTRTPLVPRTPRSEITPPRPLPTGTVVPPGPLPTGTVVPPRQLPTGTVVPPGPLPTGTVVPPRQPISTATPLAEPPPSATVRHAGGIILTATALAVSPPATPTPRPPRDLPPTPELTRTPPVPPRSR